MPFGLGGIIDTITGKQDAPSDKELGRAAGPWIPTQGPLKDILELLGKQIGEFNPQYGPSSVAGFNSDQRSSLDAMSRLGQSGVPGLSGFQSFLTGELGSSGSPGDAFLRGMGQGNYDNPFSSGFDKAFGAASGPATQTGINTLTKFAQGGFMGKNPYLDSQIKRLSKDNTRNFNETINPQLEGQLSMSGSGGGSMEALLRGRAIGDNQQGLNSAIGDMRLGAYNSDMSNMLGAAGALPGAVGQQVNNLLGAAGAQSANYRSDIANRAAGYDTLNSRMNENFTRDMAAGQGLGSLWNMMLAGPQLQGQVGDVRQNQTNRELAENRDRFLFDQNSPFNGLDAILQRLLPISSLGTPAGAAGLDKHGSLKETFSNVGSIGSLITGLMGGGAK